ncbi:DNA topoisomerase I [archaeon SCG-AAA382B04]|nr:DNA topoisomerase I [archaeon SCG-AAA382B04]
MMDNLIIAEKKNAAKRISEILSNNSYNTKKENKINTYNFETKDDSFKVIGLRGHILKLDFTEEYSNWQKTDPKELIKTDLEKKPLHKNIVSLLKDLSQEASGIIIATDFDREGELIGSDAAQIIEKNKNGAEMKRVRFSSLTQEEVRNAFNNPQELDKNLSDSGEARQVIDLIWGASLTRFISLTAKRYGSNFLSVGRVQTPTLSLIVDKEKEIEEFDPETYWKISADFQKKQKEFTAKHQAGRIWEEDEANQIMKNLTDKAIVSEIIKSKKKETPPIPFNTTQYQRAAGAIGVSPSLAMSVAEDLYTEGLISYPRTDNTVYPDDLGFKKILSQLSDNNELSEYANSLLKKDEYSPTRGDKETTDHPPIYPTSVAQKNKLSDLEWKIYQLIARRFFATLASNAIKKIIRVELDSNGEIFKTKGSKYLKLGWRWHYPYYSRKEKEIPELEEKEELEIMKKNKEEKQTQPPNRYGSNRLMSKMEDLDLGTKSTRHNILSKLYSRNYVHGDPPKPTSTAISVVETLEDYAKEITEHEMTATLEKEMDKISEGEISEQEVIKDSRQMLTKVFRELEEDKEKISESLREGLRKDKIIGTCPECGENLIIRRSKKGSRFVGCSGYPECEFSLPLPKQGRLIKTKQKCDEHDMFKLKVNKKGQKSWFLGCPQCNYDEWKKDQN